MPKIFCIGFQKTGTTSLGRALEVLGYRVCNPDVFVTDPNIGEKALDYAIEKIPQYDAFQDNPWPLLYKELDARYPGSRFILTTRHPRSWLRSVKKYFGPYEAAAEVWIYGGVGTPYKNQKRFLQRYKRHNREVREYFKGRPNDFLEIDLGKGHGWKEICAFLEQPAPETPFPFENKSGSVSAEMQRHAVGMFATARTNFHRTNAHMLKSIQAFFADFIGY